MVGLSEETARKLIHQMGSLESTVLHHINNQKEINVNVASRLEKQDDKIDAVTDEIGGYKKLIRGVVIGVGLGGTSLGAAIMKLAKVQW